jgi:hypothetical protein
VDSFKPTMVAHPNSGYQNPLSKGGPLRLNHSYELSDLRWWVKAEGWMSLEKSSEVRGEFLVFALSLGSA